MSIKKITIGYAIQTFDEDSGDCIHQEFVAGDQVDYEDVDGCALDDTDNAYFRKWGNKFNPQTLKYQPFEMVQPMFRSKPPV